MLTNDPKLPLVKYPTSIQEFDSIDWNKISPINVLKYCAWAWENGYRSELGEAYVPCAACRKWITCSRCPLNSFFEISLETSGACCNISDWRDYFSGDYNPKPIIDYINGIIKKMESSKEQK